MPQQLARQQLLTLLGQPPVTLPESTEQEWTTLLDMASQHRLLPLLQWQLKHEDVRDSIPAAVHERLAAAGQRSTLRCLRQGAALRQVTQLLDEAGIESLVLKGAYLAFYVYPAAGLRPMRDLDILVPYAQALRAFECLQQAGFVQSEQSKGHARDWLDKHWHLPPLIDGHGVCIEVHSSVFTTDIHDAYLSHAQLRARAIEAQAPGAPTMRVLSPTDQLLHLIVHAVYQHQLDNGPLIISDIAMLLKKHSIDWPLFWRLAEHGGYSKGCYLLLEMTRQAWPQLELPPMAAEHQPSREVMHISKQLLLNSQQSHRDAYYLMLLDKQQTLSGKLRIYAQALFPSREKLISMQGTPDSALLGYWIRWQRFFTQRLPEHLRARRDPQLGEQTRLLADFERWLNS